MTIKETKITCQNCDNECTVLYNSNETSIEPLICPFCGDSVNIEEYDENIEDDVDYTEEDDEDSYWKEKKK